jgi:oligopeptide/dipeptide ABC transporter ATP-binding protein
MHEPLLRARGVVKHYPVRRGLLQREVGQIQAVDGFDLDVFPGETVGLVGESGCGKSTISRVLVGLLKPTAGQVLFEGSDIGRLRRSELKLIRQDIQFVFQDPIGSLDPRMKIGDIVAEGLNAQGGLSRAETGRLVREILHSVGLPDEVMRRYPHEFSGGQRQRIGIARALVLRPKLVIADEPVSALDVSIQSQVLNLLVKLKRELQLTYVLVAHNLAVVGYISDRIAVMYLGKIVELAKTADLFANPLHPYTQALLSAVPEPVVGRQRKRIVLSGDVPSPVNPPSGCRFRTRCPRAQPICEAQEPQLQTRSTGSEGHLAACHFA